MQLKVPKQNTVNIIGLRLDNENPVVSINLLWPSNMVNCDRILAIGDSHETHECIHVYMCCCLC